MSTIKKSSKGIDYLVEVLRDAPRTVTRVVFWKIPHSNKQKEDICLKIGRYEKAATHELEVLEQENPKSELTLDDDEFRALINFLQENYEPFRSGVRSYIPISSDMDQGNVATLKSLFNNPNTQEILDFIVKNEIIPDDLVTGLQNVSRSQAVADFENMLTQDLPESKWQKWFQSNGWVFGTDFVGIVDTRSIDTEHIADYLMRAYDDFIDVIEIKRPGGGLKFWATKTDHDNYVPSADLVKAITQSTKYIYEIEREANSVKFLERTDGVKVIKPRCVLIYGRSNDWDEEQKKDYRILNSAYHNLTIMTYDHVLSRAKKILGLDMGVRDIDPNDIPF